MIKAILILKGWVKSDLLSDGLLPEWDAESRVLNRTEEVEKLAGWILPRSSAYREALGL